MTCAVCNSPVLSRRSDAKYCSPSCKYKANRSTESTAEYTNSPHGRAVILWHNSKSRHDIHTITIDWIEDILKEGVCQVTGLPFTFSHGKGKQAYAPSLDRVNPNEGYTPENTRVVIWMYNAAKNIFTDEEVLTMAKALVDKDGSMKSQTSKRERRK